MESPVKITLPPYAALALSCLEQSGWAAWCVGGCVRDSLLGKAPEDWDIATAAAPEETKRCFRNFTTIDIGIKHGTVTVLLDGHPVEITTFRSDGGYQDHRHPEQVRFSRRLEDDLSRRDFTINAMAYHPRRGLTDLFGGLADLENRTLRCVGKPELRFEEDALRILRCLRFASVLGFSIEGNTAGALTEKRVLLENVSAERIREELTKLLCGESAAAILRQYSKVVFEVLPELAPMKNCGQENPYHCYDVWEHTLHAIDAIPSNGILRWAALLHDCGKPSAKFFSPDGTAHFYGHEKESVKIARAVLEALRFSNRETEAILKLVQYHGEIHPMAEKRIKKLMGQLGNGFLSQLFQLSRADLSAQAAWLYPERIAAIRQSESLARKVLEEKQCLSLRDLAVNGGDLLSLGYEAGPALGKSLSLLLEGVLDGSLPNEKAALLQKAEELLSAKHG